MAGSVLVYACFYDKDGRCRRRCHTTTRATAADADDDIDYVWNDG